MLKQVISFGCWLLLLILAGCGEASPYAEEPSAQERTIILNLDITTKTTAPVEESPDNFHLWIFSGDKLLKYIGTNPAWDDVYNGGIDLKTTVETEIDATGITAIQFYLLLNVPEGKITNANNMALNSLKDLTFTLPEKPYSHDNKVPMSGEAKLGILPNQLHYDVSIDATRCVAKLGIYCTKSNLKSTLTINQITLSKVPDKGYLFEVPEKSQIDYSGSKSLLSENKDVKQCYTEEMPSYSNNSWAETAEANFDEVSSPYLLENLNGEVTDDGFLQVDGTVSDDRYCITLDYTLNEAKYTKKIYVSQIERNQYSKIYIRINDAITVNVCCQVNSWTEHTMDVPAFE